MFITFTTAFQRISDLANQSDATVGVATSTVDIKYLS